MADEGCPHDCQQSGAGTNNSDDHRPDEGPHDPPLTISENATQLIGVILDQIKEFTNVEKHFLYLKLFQASNVVDPLRQPLNPLGSRSEINRTISWIKTHLEEDLDTSLPKQQVYDEYSEYCIANQIKSLSQADFGKVMKQVYPKVRARRLGTRGNSRYCYSGLKRCIKLQPPQLPDLADKPLSTEAPCSESSLLAASWLIIKEWSEVHFGTKFASQPAFARYLMSQHSIGANTEAANQLAAASLPTNKHRETQLQLQRKLQAKHENRKRKNQLNNNNNNNNNAKKVSSRKKSRTEASVSPAPGESSTTTSTTGGSRSTSPLATPSSAKSICDKAFDFAEMPTSPATLPDFKSFQKLAEIGGGGVKFNKVAIPRLGKAVQQAMEEGKGKQVKYKNIQPKPRQQAAMEQQQQQTQCDIASYNNSQILNADHIRSQGVVVQLPNVDRIKERKSSDDDCDAPVFPLPRERLDSISNVEKDAMDEYLGTNNSQHEEELTKYFGNAQLDQQVSQLRQILKQNGVQSSAALPQQPFPPPLPTNPAISLPPLNLNYALSSTTILPLKTSRRVSFETQQDQILPANAPIPPSPNTRRKKFSFTPISPGPLSPQTDGQSKCSSTNVSPFVSPRNTPIPRSKNSTHQNAGFSTARSINNNNYNSNNNNSGKKKVKELKLMDNETECKSVLEKLLHTSGKVSYTPNYATKSAGIAEMPAFFGSSMDAFMYRSQSAPLSQPEPFTAADYLPGPEFSDYDPQPINVDGIIDSLGEQPPFLEQQAPSSGVGLPRFGLLGLAYDAKPSPSRSVPSTPLPFEAGGAVGQASRSYPSTPLIAAAGEAGFNYAVNNDCLLNGQPIRATDDAGGARALYMFGGEGGQAEEFGMERGQYDEVMDENGVLIAEQSFNGN